VRVLKREQFAPQNVQDAALLPRVGRFYPKGILKDIPGIFSANREPFRCLQLNNGHITVDLGHPLADKNLSLTVTIGNVSKKTKERGGVSVDWSATISRGVGMQAPWRNTSTDFLDDAAFERPDESADEIFYQRPRLVDHLDATALDMVRQIYRRFIVEDMHILDLMSSWKSHVPSDIRLKQVTGIGLNQRELAMNRSLSEYQIQDLNKEPVLKEPSNHYDAVISTVSVEYLIRPEKIFSEVARVLRPGGYFIITFSNRCFPPKAINIWSRLYEFERMGLVLNYFHGSHRFADLHTYSVRGLPRPKQDKYFGRLLHSDPIYAIWGRRNTVI
jgi:SAM-dependent methyltransferase